ncbi:MAG: dienelactone hydrolase family protein [Candidatus Limnocylindrales bacterium]
MCFPDGAVPPIPPIAGGALDSSRLVLTASDGTRLDAFAARPANPTGAGIVIIPDNRGLNPFYEELTLRFAEAGVGAVAFDFYGRTAAPLAGRGSDFNGMEHAGQTTWRGIRADLDASIERLGSAMDGAPRSVFVVGFCFGGRLAFDAASLDIGIAGAIGFYGLPTGPGRNDAPAPVDVADRMRCPILGLFGGADRAIGPEAVAAFEAALTRGGVEHEIVTYPDAPHSFFDRTFEEHAAASADAWARTLAFIRAHTAPAGAGGPA